jgi:osmotically-inducible protein OsmY
MSHGLAQSAPEALRDAVIAEIDGDPALHPWEIAVAAEDGVITLTGTVERAGFKVAAERAAKRIEGVRSIANELRVRGQNERTDTDIARDAAHRLRNNLSVPEGVQAVVSDGSITLDGTVSWMQQRAAAENAVKYLRGVKGVTNNIHLVQS